MSNLNKDKKYFEYAIVVGDQKKFLSVLLIPTKKYNSLKVSDESIKQSIDVTNKKAPNSASTLKKFVVLEGEVFEIGDLLTPTLKIRRKNICDRYKYQIDALYQSEE
jgi:long-chain acyl-CoA synthetase